jgi:Phytanoyl-CoA dioxygenase (PhyH)
VDELADSSRIAGDLAALRQRFAADGYLFFRGLLPAGQVRAAGAAVAAHLRSGGWVDDKGSPPPGAGAVQLTDALTDPAFRRALTCAEFNQIPYLPPLRGLVRAILGRSAFSYPAKVLRAIHPERPRSRTKGRYAHHDYAVSGVQDMLTTWLPLMDIPVRLGGLAVRPGGQLGRPIVPWVLRPAQRGWATADYRPGDVIMFHCLTPHAALPNTTSALRLSGDFRWQRPDGPAPAELILGPAARGGAAGQPELFSRLFGRAPWWEPVPAGLTLLPRATLAASPPSPSQFFPVHPAWARWRPPGGAVH